MGTGAPAAAGWLPPVFRSPVGAVAHPAAARRAASVAVRTTPGGSPAPVPPAGPPPPAASSAGGAGSAGTLRYALLALLVASGVCRAPRAGRRRFFIPPALPRVAFVSLLERPG